MASLRRLRWHDVTGESLPSMIDTDPASVRPKAARAFDVLTAMLVTAFIGGVLIIFGR